MNCLVVGAGNAGRPVARLLNNQGENVIITDPKTIDEFKEDVQKILKQIEKEGVVLDLGNPDPSVDGIDMVYKAPTLPDSAPISKKIKEANLKVLSNEEFSKMVNDLIPVDILGITGTMGKTTTTFITTAIFKQAGYDTEVVPVTTAEYGISKAARPFNSRLDKRKLVENGFKPLPTWQDAVARYLKEIM